MRNSANVVVVCVNVVVDVLIVPYCAAIVAVVIDVYSAYSFAYSDSAGLGCANEPTMTLLLSKNKWCKLKIKINVVFYGMNLLLKYLEMYVYTN